jgi:hypothetical protein
MRRHAIGKIVPILINMMALPSPALAQAQKPIATYTFDLSHTLSGYDGNHFGWAAAPDGSLIITTWRPHHQWAVSRLSGLESGKPHLQTIQLSMTLPEPHPEKRVGPPNPLVDPTGHYVILRSPPINVGDNGSNLQNWQATIAIVDLNTFTLAHSSKVTHGFEDGSLFFSQNGALLLDATASGGGRSLTTLALPSLDRLAVCEYRTKNQTGAADDEWPPDFTVTEKTPSCDQVVSIADAPNLKQLLDRYSPEKPMRHLAGNDCEFQQVSATQLTALYRCGKDHLAGEDGALLTFWYALKVISLPGAKTILTIPLHFYDSESSGLFHQVDGQQYLTVRHGNKLSMYQVPVTLTPP